MFKRVFLSHYLLIVLLIPQISKSQDLLQDSLALVQFYQATGGDDWNNNDQWLAGPLASWEGVSLFNERVDTLRFSNNNLVGDLPSVISELNSLRSLTIGNNAGLTGVIPSSISNLTALSTLVIAGNGLTGSLPSQLGSLTMLRVLDIGGNNIAGPIPSSLGNLTNLEVLNLSEEQINGTIPASVYNLINLRQFVIECDSLEGQISDNIGNLDQLTTFALGGTKISGTIPSSLSNARNLRFFILIDNRNLDGSLPSQLWGLSNVGFMALTNNQLSGVISPEIGDAVRLQQLFINDNRFEGEFPDEVIGLDSLQVVALQNNYFSGLPDMSAMESLGVLTVQNNHLTFEDIEPNLALRDQGKTFIYSPQKPVYDTTIISARAGSRLVIRSEIEGSANRYQWFREGEIVDGETNTDLAFENLTVLDAGSYSAEITSAIVTDLTLERNPITIRISINEPVRFCDPVTLESSIADTTATYTWSTGETTPSITITDPGSYSVIIETVNYVLEETFITELGISSLIAGADIDFDTFIGEQALPEDQVLLVNGPVQLVNTSVAGSDFQWDLGDGTTTVEANPFHTFTNPGTYTIRLNAVDDEGCEIVYERPVEVQELFVTNAITPNNDGSNDQLFVEPFLYPTGLRLVNRWGQEVYSNENYQDDFSGEGLTPGVYFYELTIANADKQVTGTVTIIE